MFDDSSFDYQFFYGIMAFADSLMDNSCAFSSRSMTPPLFGSGNRQFGKMVPNNRDHLEMQQQPPKQQFGRRRRQRKQENQHQNGMIFCRYCPNKMPAAHMAGHLERKHNILPRSDGHAPNAKRKRAVLDDDDELATMEHQINKRSRVNANSTSIQELSSINASILRPLTPSPPPPSAIGNPTNCNATGQASTLQDARVQNEKYNVIHISDRELNKFMRNGRIEVHNGKLILGDSIGQE